MAKVSKIDSNITGLAYAEEARLGVLPGESGEGGTPEWKMLAPNSYSDFGGEVVTTSPNPINPSRQRRKGVTTDLNASGGFNHNLTYYNLMDLMQGVIFADIRRKPAVRPDSVSSSSFSVSSTEGFLENSLVRGEGFSFYENNRLKVVQSVTSGSTISVSGSLTSESEVSDQAMLRVVGHQGSFSVDNSLDFPALTGSVDFTTLGLVPGQWIFVGGDQSSHRFSSKGNNGFKRVREVLSDRLVLDKSDSAMKNEENNGKDVRIFYGDVLKNEQYEDIVERSYQLERLLGSPDTSASVGTQSEVLTGSVPNEFTVNVPTSDLVNVDVSFISTDNVQRTADEGPKQADVKDFLTATEFNTSSDITRIKMSEVSSNDEAPRALFAFLTEANITVNNNVSRNKAIGLLGAFDVTAGTFAVSGSVTAYFASVEATQAVRNNADVTIDMIFVKNNRGMVYDLPLISLGDGRLNVETDQAITLPLNMEAARGLDVDANLDHTLLLTYFNFLPESAEG